MKALSVEGYGWQHHPVTAMWRGHRFTLMAHQAVACEVRSAHFADPCPIETFDVLAEIPDGADAYFAGTYPLPRGSDAPT